MARPFFCVCFLFLFLNVQVYSQSKEIIVPPKDKALVYVLRSFYKPLAYHDHDSTFIFCNEVYMSTLTNQSYFVLELDSGEYRFNQDYVKKRKGVLLQAKAGEVYFLLQEITGYHPRHSGENKIHLAQHHVSAKMKFITKEEAKKRLIKCPRFIGQVSFKGVKKALVTDDDLVFDFERQEKGAYYKQLEEKLKNDRSVKMYRFVEYKDKKNVPKYHGFEVSFLRYHFTPEWRKVGLYEYFHKNGAVLEKGSFNLNGERHGVFKHYNKKGELKKEKIFDDGAINL